MVIAPSEGVRMEQPAKRIRFSPCQRDAEQCASDFERAIELIEGDAEDKIQQLQPLICEHNINMQDEIEGSTLLMHAAKHGPLEVVTFLVESGTHFFEKKCFFKRHAILFL